MAEAVHQEKIPSLAEQWLLLEKDELADLGNSYPAFASEEIVPERNDQALIAEENGPTTGENNEIHNLKEGPTNVEKKQEVKENSYIVKENSATPDQTAEQSQDVDEKEVSTENAPTPEENNENTLEEEQAQVEEKEEADEETPVFKLETAPADFRFPTTNQTRHCFTRYIEYHRCIAAKGEGAPECQKFAKYYRSLCPGEWIERWNEQRANGTFPGPL